MTRVLRKAKEAAESNACDWSYNRAESQLAPPSRPRAKRFARGSGAIWAEGAQTRLESEGEKRW